jgi:protein-tyrosine phosphatase
LELFEIESINNCFICIASCPRVDENGEPNLKSVQESIDDILLVSLLTSSEIKNLNLGKEEAITKELGIDFINFPIADMGIPVYKQFVEFIDKLYSKTDGLDKLIIHCKHGIGRSGLIALGLMVRDGGELKLAIKKVSKIRGFDIPQSSSQRKLLSHYFKEVNLK